MSHTVLGAACLLIAYLLGSIPFGLIVARRWFGIDIRTAGSGNIGATNVGRICGRRAGMAVFCLDVGKGAIPPLLATFLKLPSAIQVLAGLLAVVGHTFPVWLRFRGGKGVATGLGALLGIAPPVGLICYAVFGGVRALSRMVSVASIAAMLAAPALSALIYRGDWPRLLLCIAAAAIGIYKHRSNIQRIRQGTEPTIDR